MTGLWDTFSAMNLILGSSNVSASIGLLQMYFRYRVMGCLGAENTNDAQALAPCAELRIRIGRDGKCGHDAHLVDRVICMRCLRKKIVILDLLGHLLQKSQGLVE